MLNQFIVAYKQAAIWSSSDDDGTPLDSNHTIEEISSVLSDKMENDCRVFYEKFSQFFTTEHCPHCGDILTATERAGHDFWLTRNGHGAGFWDGDWSDEANKEMTEYCHSVKGVDLYVGDDGKIYA